MLVSMIFSIRALPISPTNELRHLELFAGDCSVSRAEHMDRGLYCQHVSCMMLYKDFLPQNPPVEIGIAFDKVF